MKRRVVILHTGGTLGMRPQEPDRTLAPDEFGATVLENVPEVQEIAEIETRVLFNLDSSDIDHRHWMALAQQIVELKDQCDGVVITHGTDAMAYTACGLSFLLHNLPIPVVLTGSQRPLADARTDGRANIVGAVDMATRDIPEVTIYFNGLLLRGNRATKSSSFAFEAFVSPNHLPLAEVGTGTRWISAPLVPQGPFRMAGEFDPRIAVVWLTPGQPPDTLRCLQDTATDAVLLIAFGAGNVPVEDRGIAAAVRELVDSGKLVAIGSQAPNGRVDLGRYVGGRLLRDAGAVGTADMTIEASSVKLMYLMGTCTDPAEARLRLKEPIAGEIDEFPAPSRRS